MTVKDCHDNSITVSLHARQRFLERAPLIFTGGQMANETMAMDLLRKRIKRAGIRKRRPGWAHGTGDLAHRTLTEGYIVIAEAVAFPVERINGALTITTCIVRGWSRERGSA